MSFEALKRLKQEKIKRLRETWKEEREIILRYIAVPPFMLRAKNPMHAAVIVGPMFSGKTSFGEAKIGEAIGYLVEKYGVEEHSIAYVHSYERSVSEIVSYMAKNLELKKLSHIFFFNDDAIAVETAFARLSWKEESTNEARYYVMIRHRLEKLGFTGYLFILHATQVFSLLDKTFRQTAALKFFKDYPDEPNDMRLMGIMLGKAGMMALNELSLKLWSPMSFRHYLEAVYSAVAKIKRLRRIVRAYETDPEKDPARYRRWLSKINNITIEARGVDETGPGPDDVNINSETIPLYNMLKRILIKLREKEQLTLAGNRVILYIDGEKLVLQTRYIPRSILKRIKQIKVRRVRRTSQGDKQ